MGGQVALTQSGRRNVEGVRVVSAPLSARPPSLPHTYYVAGDHKEIAGRSRLLARPCESSCRRHRARKQAEHPAVSGVTTELPCKESQSWAKTRAKCIVNPKPHLLPGLPCLFTLSHQSCISRRLTSSLTLTQKPLPGLFNQPMQWIFPFLPRIKIAPSISHFIRNWKDVLLMASKLPPC